MKTPLFSLWQLLLFISFLSMSKLCLGQGAVISSAGFTVEPETSVQYTLVGPSFNFTGCNVTWTITAGTGNFYFRGSGITATSTTGTSTINAWFENNCGNATVTATVSSCTAGGGNTSLNGNTYANSLPVACIGSITPIKINASSVGNPYTYPCGTTPFTASVDPVTNADTYTWTLPSGWTQSGSGNSITITPNINSSGTLSVQASRSDNSKNKPSTSLSINRPLPITPIINSYQSLICSGSTTVSANSLNADSYTWEGSSNGNVLVNSGSSYTGGNSVSLSGASSGGGLGGSFRVRGNSSACGVSTSYAGGDFWVGTPGHFDISGPELICANNVYQSNIVNSPTNVMDHASYSWSSSSGNMSVTGGGTVASISSCCTGSYLVYVTATNSCGTNNNSLGIDVSICFARYSVYPNPATDFISIDFEEIDRVESLPESIELFSEKSTKPLKVISVWEAYKQGSFDGGKQLKIEVKDYPRGTYYLQVKNSQNVEKPINAIRIVLQ
jgi:hypothetical protein